MIRLIVLYTSVAEPEPHLLVGAGAETRCVSGSDNGIKHAKNENLCVGGRLTERCLLSENMFCEEALNKYLKDKAVGY
jgi:hypothetical protein